MSINPFSALIPGAATFKDALAALPSLPGLPAMPGLPSLPNLAFAWPEMPVPTQEALAARASATDLPVLKAREVTFGGKDRAVRAWALSQTGATLAAGRQAVVFVETSTPTSAAAAHAQWLGWQRQTVANGHPTYCVVVPRLGSDAADSEQACEALNACLKDARATQSAVVLRFDAASTMVPCLASAPQRVSELVLGPLPLWPLPTVQAGVHPLSTWHSMFGWMDNGSFNALTKAAWQVMDHPMAATAAPALVQAAVWQDQLARAALPGETSAQALAAALGPWLVSGVAGVLADDWALRRVAATAKAEWPVRAVFSAEESEATRAWAQDYVRDLFGAWGAASQVVMGADVGLPLSKRAAPAKPVVTKSAAKPAVKVEVKPAVKPAIKAVVKPVADRRPVATPTKPRVVAKPDDLKVIEGIGPQIAKLLNNDGITTFEGLSRAPVARLKQVLTAAGPRFAMANPGTWAQQAGLLARGDKAAFEALTKRLRAGVAV
jgi:predicted flap endonuclease-1-like 5' DNA nuclease